MKQYTKKTIEFYDKYIKEYTKNGSVVLGDKINRFIKLLPGKKVLDIACGSGHDTDYLTKKGLDCLGIDLSKKMVDFAKKNRKGKFEIADFLDLKFNEKSFDGIWCSSAFTHIDKSDLPNTLLDFRRILKKNGILAIIVPENQNRKKNKNDTRIFSMFKKRELKNYLNNTGFNILYYEVFSFSEMNWIFVLSRK